MSGGRNTNILFFPISSKSQIVINASVYGISHGLVDGACAVVIFSNFAGMQGATGYFAFLLVLYNVLAFSLQAPVGLMVDILKIPTFISAAGCLMVALSLVLFKSTLISIVLAGIGNAFFHSGGGVISLNLKPGKASMPGIFVAPGALGLMAGTIVGKSGSFAVIPFVSFLIIAAIAILLVKPPHINYSIKARKDTNYFELIILLLLISVAIRALIGLAVVFPWKSNIFLLVCLTLAVVLGKALGGILADRFGWIRISVTGLLVSAPLLSFGAEYPLPAICGVFLFNMTMPVTLAAAANILPGRSGFAFGLTTLALITGALPTFTEYKAVFSQGWIVLAAVLLSVIALYIGLKLYSGRNIFITRKENTSTLG